ncbi:MAG TPA: hypothetical protein VFJ57_02350 [Solirubrobacterales bacterium]|nr:hypothetical protein [Solirubrobacterales bacterium]
MRKRLLLAVAAASLISLVFAGGAHAAGGSVIGWGENEYGEVGAGTPGVEVKTPTPVPNLSEVTEVSRGYTHTLALRSNGGVVGWGENEDGQLGDGSTTNSPVPVPVNGLPSAVAIAAGGYGSIALLPNGTVMAWGYAEAGGLGQGNSTGPELCGPSGCSRKPVVVPGLTNIVAIDAGYEYFIALRSDGTVWFWGYDRYGESGNGTGTQIGCECIDHPVQVPGVTGAVAISADWYLASALLANGTIKDWGYNFYAEVGDGSRNNEAPTPCFCSVPVTVSGVSGAKETASGGYHGLALFPGGAGLSWGYDEYGQLGNGVFMTTGCECFPLPGPISGLAGVRQVDAGPYSSYALLNDGTVRSWGYNGEGALGDGTEENRSTPVPIAAAGVSSVVAAGSYGAEAIVGPSQILKVELAGAGSGTVGGDGIVCPAGCENAFPQGAVKSLLAEAKLGSPFAGFSGACTGTGVCQVTMTQNQTVTATFGVPKGTAITKAKISSKKKTAEFQFSTPGAITGYECKLIRPKKHAKKQGKGGKASKAKKKKAKPPKFVGCASGKSYKNLAPGAYTFKVRGLDIVGADATPATRHFKIKLVKHKKHHKKH